MRIFAILKIPNFYIRPQAPKYCPIIFLNMGTFLGKMKSYTLLSLVVEVDSSDLAITLSSNDKIYPKTEKKIHVNRTSKMS